MLQCCDIVKFIEVVIEEGVLGVWQVFWRWFRVVVDQFLWKVSISELELFVVVFDVIWDEVNIVLKSFMNDMNLSVNEF